MRRADLEAGGNRADDCGMAMVKTTLVIDVDPLKLGRFIDRKALFMQHWRFRRAGADPGEWNHRMAVELEPMLSARMAEYCGRGVFRPAAVMAVFPTVADGDTMVLLDNGIEAPGVEIARFPFPRLADGTCVTDYIRQSAAEPTESPAQTTARGSGSPGRHIGDVAEATESPAHTTARGSGSPGRHIGDVAEATESVARMKGAAVQNTGATVQNTGAAAQYSRQVEPAPVPTGWFAATLGPAVAEIEAELKASGCYEEYHLLHGLGAALAEALAEEIHRRLRIELGIAQYDAATPAEIVRGGYCGRRLSFGYSCCPDLSLQAPLLSILDTSRIGLTLSPAFQMVPELSVSAMVLI